MHSVVLPCKVEKAVNGVGNEAALVNREALKRFMSVKFGISALPKEFSWVGNNSAADRQIGDMWIRHAAGQEVELESRNRMSGIGPSVHFHDGSHDVFTSRSFAQFLNDLKDDTALAFVACGDAGIGNQL